MIALVTGAGVRVGRAIALELARDGFELRLHVRSSVGPAEQLAEEIRDQGGRARVLQADLATVAGCDRLVERAGAVDVLVNSAAAYTGLPVEEIDAQRWDAMQAVNCRAPFLLTRGLLPGLRASELDGGGCVINLTDIGAERPVPGFAHYTASKAALIALTRALALELAPALRVNAISPGTVLPPTDLDEDALSAIRDTIPLGRFGSAQDIARTARFLVRSPYVTGQIWAVDGGRSVGGPMEAG